MKKPHILFILSALLLVNAVSCVPDNGKDEASILVVTNGKAWIYPFRSDHTSDLRLQPGLPIGPATRQSLVYTNLEGMWFIMATATNVYVVGMPVFCRTYVWTSATNHIYVRGGSSIDGFAPDFGSLAAQNDRGEIQPLKPHQVPVDTRLPSYQLPLVNRGSSGLPSSFRLDDYFDLSQPGTYRISFKGRLPSGAHPTKEIEFETAPLVLHILPETKKESGGNSPPR